MDFHKRQRFSISSITQDVRAALSALLGQAPTPFSASTIAWISGC
jgi:hypothetical protein